MNLHIFRWPSSPFFSSICRLSRLCFSGTPYLSVPSAFHFVAFIVHTRMLVVGSKASALSSSYVLMTLLFLRVFTLPHTSMFFSLCVCVLPLPLFFICHLRLVGKACSNVGIWSQENRPKHSVQPSIRPSICVAIGRKGKQNNQSDDGWI